MNILLTCILYCDAGPGGNQNCLQIQYVYFLITDIIFALVRFSYVLALLRESYLQLSGRAYVLAGA